MVPLGTVSLLIELIEAKQVFCGLHELMIYAFGLNVHFKGYSSANNVVKQRIVGQSYKKFDRVSANVHALSCRDDEGC